MQLWTLRTQTFLPALYGTFHQCKLEVLVQCVGCMYCNCLTYDIHSGAGITLLLMEQLEALTSVVIAAWRLSAPVCPLAALLDA